MPCKAGIHSVGSTHSHPWQAASKCCVTEPGKAPPTLSNNEEIFHEETQVAFRGHAVCRDSSRGACRICANCALCGCWFFGDVSRFPGGSRQRYASCHRPAGNDFPPLERQNQ